MPQHKASCHCGQLSIMANQDPDHVFACACNACQKRTGAVFGAAAYFQRTCLTTTGQSTAYTRSSDRGNSLELHFCPTCGSTLWWSLDMWPTRLGVALGTFDSPAPTPSQAFNTTTLPDWVHFNSDITRN